MMNREQAMAYGKARGCKYYVKNINGGLMGGFTTMAAAEEHKAECESKYGNDPWNNDLKFYIETI